AFPKRRVTRRQLPVRRGLSRVRLAGGALQKASDHETHRERATKEQAWPLSGELMGISTQVAEIGGAHVVGDFRDGFAYFVYVLSGEVVLVPQLIARTAQGVAHTCD